MDPNLNLPPKQPSTEEQKAMKKLLRKKTKI